jgi:hypothetical protein
LSGTTKEGTRRPFRSQVVEPTAGHEDGEVSVRGRLTAGSWKNWSIYFSGEEPGFPWNDSCAPVPPIHGFAAMDSIILQSRLICGPMHLLLAEKDRLGKFPQGDKQFIPIYLSLYYGFLPSCSV